MFLLLWHHVVSHNICANTIHFESFRFLKSEIVSNNKTLLVINILLLV